MDGARDSPMTCPTCTRTITPPEWDYRQGRHEELECSCGALLQWHHLGRSQARADIRGEYGSCPSLCRDHKAAAVTPVWP